MVMIGAYRLQDALEDLVVLDRVATVSTHHVRRLVWKIGVHVGGSMLEDERGVL